jgi:signal peptidase I
VTDYTKILKKRLRKTYSHRCLDGLTIILGFYFGLRVAFGTSVPIRVVMSGSMCTIESECDGWSDVFTNTLHRGDIIIVQSINSEDLNSDYPNSDIIVYQNPSLSGNPEATPIVHRIVAKYQINGTWYFQTKGDGNDLNWPLPVNPTRVMILTLFGTQAEGYQKILYWVKW